MKRYTEEEKAVRLLAQIPAKTQSVSDCGPGTIKELFNTCENVPSWLAKAITQDEWVSIRSGKVIWHDGRWINGTWHNGTWENSRWIDGLCYAQTCPK